ncbi:helix-turn-helix domain-containing protein [Crenobacter sp. SG2305]|uniref:helix-turn-helix domain-containing protein n=1 Tax=Crenobacter oryzisoli TaxID=3056844 RepID=UPI0025AA7298|nr:helix-turn-helix domain-containing protein [Crenobacter sp. SG2305]MDN0085572.1 helix-turn-helix domain-containing protein [Crenobacter sp. SG2305]
MNRHVCDAVALENADVCSIPFDQLEKLSPSLPSLQVGLSKLLSREIAREYSVMFMLGSMNTDERLAAFLVNLSRRHAQRGYSPTRILLRVSREEISSFRGVTLETISRGFSRLLRLNFIEVNGKEVVIKYMESLMDGIE